MSSGHRGNQNWDQSDWGPLSHSPAITSPPYPFSPQNSYTADIISWSSICTSECILDQSPWQESSQTSCFMLQLNSMMFLCGNGCGGWGWVRSFFNLWHYSNKENCAQDELNTRLTCYLFALLVTTKPRGEDPQSLTSPPRVWQLAHSPVGNIQWTEEDQCVHFQGGMTSPRIVWQSHLCPLI